MEMSTSGYSKRNEACSAGSPSDAADDVMPVWSPDGDRIVFSSNRKGVHDLYQKSVSRRAGNEELLLSTPEPKVASDWSADGRFVLFNSQNPKTKR